MEIIVRFHPSVLLYLNDLVDVLFYENYFSVKESAIDYVVKLIDLVENQIDKKKHHITPQSVSVYGEYLINLKINPKTTWYFVFNKNENQYLVSYVFNNYSKEAKYLNL